MEEKTFEVIVTMRNVYRIAAEDAADARRRAAEDYIWGEDAETYLEVSLADEGIEEDDE